LALIYLPCAAFCHALVARIKLACAASSQKSSFHSGKYNWQYQFHALLDSSWLGICNNGQRIEHGKKLGRLMLAAFVLSRRVCENYLVTGNQIILEPVTTWA
jgi:hypothetical protein